jgi:O-antigen ligase/polysaccharide polymerase Wzy-like membrane protein
MATATPRTTPAAQAGGASAPAAPADVPSRPPANRPAGALLVALLAACAYAAFAHGAVALPEETYLQVGLAVVAIIAAGMWLGRAGLRLDASPTAWWGVGLLAAFTAWSGLSLWWSIAPDRTWGELNRATAYLLLVVLGIAVGTSAARAVERLALGLLGVFLMVALYAYGGKVLPGVNVPGLFDLNHASTVSRLRAPLEYWNALALVCVIAIPIAVRVVADMDRRAIVRLAALAATCLLIVVVGLTYSRGGFLALSVAALLMTVLGGARLRGLVVLGVAGFAALLILGVAFTRVGLTGNGIPLGQRISDGRVLLGATVFCGALLMAAGLALLRLERRINWSRERSRKIWRTLGIVGLAVAVVALGGVAASDRGPGGTLSDIAKSFTETREDRVTDPVRLISTNSGNRWIWWKEAAGAFSDRPVGGWGGGSFPLVHLRYRTNRIPVAQPHSVPLQFLSETGFIGAALALGGLGALFFVAFGRVRAMPWGRERDFGVALFAGAVAWLVHGLVDWDWDIPGVTVPALVALGVLCGLPSAGAGRPRRRVGPFGEPEPSGYGLRMVALAATTLLLAVYGVSCVLPAWSDSKTAGAGIGVTSEATAEELERAAAQAELAARLDPLAVHPLFVASSIAQGRGRLLDSRRYLLEAVDRQPNNPETWLRLAALALQLADREGLRRAAYKALELDPNNPVAATLARRAEAYIAPPHLSATATGTPLPAAVAIAPVFSAPGLPGGALPGTAPPPG